MQITFYVLPPDAPTSARVSTVCRVIEKAHRRNHQIWVVAASREEAEALDEALWAFKPDSFIPHHLVGDGPTPPPPIRITWDNRAPESRDILIHMHPEFPQHFERFHRVIELVAGNDAERQHAREHWQQFKRLGQTVEAHQLNN